MIEKLFTSKTRVKLLEYFFFQMKSSRLREISRETNLPVSAVSRELNNLKNLSVIKKNKDNYVLNEDCQFLYDLRNILIKTDSFSFGLEKLFSGKKVKYAFIFGSFANDKYDSDSDIDLFVVGKIKNLEVNKMLNLIEREIGREINAVIWPVEDLKRKTKNSFIKDIAKKNILMIKGKEDELRKIIGKK